MFWWKLPPPDVTLTFPYGDEGPLGRQVTDYSLEQRALLLSKAIPIAMASPELTVFSGLAFTEIF